MTTLFRYHALAFLYFMAMTLSSTAMPIYFKNHDAVSAYGLAYSSMAMTGALAFLLGIWVDKVGYAKMLILAIFIYGTALLFRVVTDVHVAVVVAIIAGIGANIGAICIRSWTAELVRTGIQNSTKLTATRSIVNNASILTGAGLVSVLIGVLPKIYVGDYYFFMLILAGFVMIVPLILAVINDKKSAKESDDKLNQENNKINDDNQKNHNAPLKNLKKKSYRLGVLTYVLIATTFVSGIYTGMIKPYLILMFIDYGLSESKAVMMYLFMTATSMVMGFILLKFNDFFKNIPFVGLLFCESVLGGVFFGLAVTLSYQLSLVVLIGLVMLRSGMLSLAMCFDEVLQYQFLNKETISFALGLLSTAFLMGDALGSLLTGTFIVPKVIVDYVRIFYACGVLAFVNVALVLLLKKLAKNKASLPLTT